MDRRTPIGLYAAISVGSPDFNIETTIVGFQSLGTALSLSGNWSLNHNYNTIAFVTQNAPPHAVNLGERQIYDKHEQLQDRN